MAVQPYRLPKKNPLMQLGIGALGGYTAFKGQEAEKEKSQILLNLKKKELQIKEDYNTKSLEIEKAYKEGLITESQKDRALQELKLESEGWKSIGDQLSSWFTKKGERKFEIEKLEKAAELKEEGAQKEHKRSLLMEKFKAGLNKEGKTLLDKILGVQKTAVEMLQAGANLQNTLSLIKTREATDKRAQEEVVYKQQRDIEMDTFRDKKFNADETFRMTSLNYEQAKMQYGAEMSGKIAEFNAKLRDYYSDGLDPLTETAIKMTVFSMYRAMGDPSEANDRMVDQWASMAEFQFREVEGRPVTLPRIKTQDVGYTPWFGPMEGFPIGEYRATPKQRGAAPTFEAPMAPSPLPTDKITEAAQTFKTTGVSKLTPTLIKYFENKGWTPEEIERLRILVEGK